MSPIEYDETETCWHLLVRTRGGAVSILKNLDAPTARQAFQRLKPGTRPRRYINQTREAWAYGAGHVSEHEIDTVDILGPEGAQLDPWRGVEPLVIELRQRMTGDW